jgi:hypothetical protein
VCSVVVGPSMISFSVMLEDILPIYIYSLCIRSPGFSLTRESPDPHPTSPQDVSDALLLCFVVHKFTLNLSYCLKPPPILSLLSYKTDRGGCFA